MDTIRKENIKQIASYFQEGCKQPDGGFYMGLELEHFIVDKENCPISYEGACGVEELLLAIEPFYDKKGYSQGHLIALAREDAGVSIEPAGQLEISISPQTNPEKVLEIYAQFRREVEEVILPWGCRLIELGYQPRKTAEERPMIPKKRYEYMNRYFHKIGPYGCCMMRGTAATQVSIDYFDEKDFARKYKAAYMLAPFLACLTDNATMFEDKPYEEHLLRTKIWEHVDPKRTDVTEYMQDGNMSFASYAEFVYDTPLIVADKDGEDVYTEESSATLYQNRRMTEQEVEHALSMVFPSIRVKKFMEIRYADSLPIEEAVGYMMLIKGLFVKLEPVEAWLSEKKICQVQDTGRITKILQKDGMKAVIDKTPVRRYLKELGKLAAGNLSEEEQKYLTPLLMRCNEA